MNYIKDEKLLKEVKKLGLYPNEKQVNKFAIFLKKHYQLKNKAIIKYKRNNNSCINKGVFLRYNNLIIFYGNLELSVVLHEFRHYLQFNTKFDTSKDIEEDANEFSNKLIGKVFPKDKHEFQKLKQITP